MFSNRLTQASKKKHVHTMMEKKEEKCLSVCELWLVNTKERKKPKLLMAPHGKTFQMRIEIMLHTEYLAFIRSLCVRA